jgi:VanZ family protein
VSAASKPWLAAAILWTAAILVVNSISVSDPTWQPPFAGADKLTHAFMYGVASFTWRRGFASTRDAATWRVVAGVALLGALDEWHQRIVPGRSADLFDWVADVVGAWLGVALWHWLKVRRGVGA